MAAERLLIIGNGMAATRLLQELVREGFAGRITVVGDEPGVGYNRIQLTPWLADAVDEPSLDLVDRAWYDRAGIDLISSDAVVDLDPTGLARTASGRTLAFDRCVLATGALPRLPECPYPDQPAIRAFRTKADGHWLKDLPAGRDVVVIGGGLLGLEAAWGLRQRGQNVTLVHRNRHLMNRQLSAATARYLDNAFREAGIQVRLQASLQSIQADPAIRGVTLDTGEYLNADALITAAGIQPNTGLARQAGLTVERGIVVDHHLRTSHPRLFALGECAEFQGRTFGLVNPAYQQARILAGVLCGQSRFYAVAEDSTRLKISGLDVVSMGDIAHPEARQITLDNPRQRQCRRLHLLDDRLIGFEMIGTVDHADIYQELIERHTPIIDARSVLLGQAAAA